MEDVQFGHSSRTADAVYGRNEAEVYFRNYVMKDFREISGIWHNFILHGSGSPNGDNGMGSFAGITTQIRRRREENLSAFQEAQYQRHFAPVSEPLLHQVKFRSDHLLKQEDFTRAKALLLSTTGFSDLISKVRSSG